MRRALKQLRSYLGCVFRDVGRKIAGNAALESETDWMRDVQGW
jgi:IS5 family transposase